MEPEPFADDTDTTAEFPQLDVRIIAAALERVEQSGQNVAEDSPESVPDWKRADRFAGLQDQVARLQAALTENNNSYARLSARHEALLQKLDEREHDFAATQASLNAAQQQIEHLLSYSADLKQLINDSVDQRKQRDQFILRQAREIKRLRELRS
jgi:chromosome segregation ATPase